jgi:hypothetical protein
MLVLLSAALPALRVAEPVWMSVEPALVEFTEVEGAFALTS